GQIEDLSKIKRIVIHTSHHTHYVIGTGANDPQKMDPGASRETLDHSIMYIFAVAMQDQGWHHEHSYAPERAGRPDTVELWHKIETTEDPEWTRRYHSIDPNEKAFGGRVEIEFEDGSTLVDEIAVADAHPLGARPRGPPDPGRPGPEDGADRGPGAAPPLPLDRPEREGLRRPRGDRVRGRFDAGRRDRRRRCPPPRRPSLRPGELRREVQDTGRGHRQRFRAGPVPRPGREPREPRRQGRGRAVLHRRRTRPQRIEGHLLMLGAQTTAAERRAKFRELL